MIIDINHAADKVIDLHSPDQLLTDSRIATFADDNKIDSIGIINLSQETNFSQNPLQAIYDHLKAFVTKVAETGADYFLASKLNSQIINPIVTDQIDGTKALNEASRAIAERGFFRTRIQRDEEGGDGPSVMRGSDHSLRNLATIDPNYFTRMGQLVGKTADDFFDAVPQAIRSSFVGDIKSTLYRPADGNEASQSVEDMLPFIDKVFNIQPR